MPAGELEFSTFSHGHYVDLMPYQYGREQCAPGHAFGPARRDHYLFHYIISGRGLLMTTDENGTKTDHRLQGGEGFLIFPGQVNTYVADLDDPWEYIWVEFDGIRVADDLEEVGLTSASPVYRTQSSELRALMVGEKGSMVYLASEQASIELVCPDVENVRSIEGGEPFVVQLDEVARRKQRASSENEPDLKPTVQFTGVMPAGNKRGEA